MGEADRGRGKRVRPERGERRWRCRAIIADRRCRCVLLLAPPPPSRKLPLLLAVAVEIAGLEPPRLHSRCSPFLSQPPSPPRSPSPLLQLSAPSSMGEAEERDPGGREDQDLSSHRAQLPLLSPAILIKSAASEASGCDFWPHLNLCRRRALLPPKTVCVCWKLPPEPLSSWFGFQYLRVEIKVVIEPPELWGVPELPPGRFRGSLLLCFSWLLPLL
ncbi:uncharacterized protein [Arachis hypogaea]